MGQILVLIAMAILAVCLAVPEAAGQVTPRRTFAGTGTMASSNVSWYVVPGTGDGAPVVSFFDGRADNTNAYLKFYNVPYPTNLAIVSATGTQGTNTPFASAEGNTFVAGAVVVLKHSATDTYERRVVHAQDATNVQVTAAWSVTPVIGDVLYRMQTNGHVQIAERLVQIVGTPGGIYSGPNGVPILMEVTGTGSNTVSLNLASGYYAK